MLSALQGTEIPVPRVLAICDDPDVIGAPFYLMRYVPGHGAAHPRGRRAGHARTRRASCPSSFAGMLAAIHGVDLAAVGLAGFGRPEGYLARQLARWQRQWELSNTREMPGYDELAAAARGRPAGPADGPGTLVHGDFRLDNMLVTLGAQPADRGRGGLGDVHPRRPARRPRPDPCLLGRPGRRRVDGAQRGAPTVTACPGSSAGRRSRPGTPR